MAFSWRFLWGEGKKRARTSERCFRPFFLRLHCSLARSSPRSIEKPQTTQAKDFKVRLTYIFSPKHCKGVNRASKLQRTVGAARIHWALQIQNCFFFLFKSKCYITGKKRPAWDYKGRLEDMEAFLLKSNSCMEDMTKTIGDNQGRIGYLESLNKQLEGTVQVKNQQSEQVRSVPIAVPSLGGGSRSHFPAPFARQSRTCVISVPNTVFFPNTEYSVKNLAYPTSREAVKSRFPSRNLAFSLIPHYISVTGL